MVETDCEVFVPLSPAAAFDLYVNQIDTWWPRQGVFPYSFAPATTRPAHIHFEGEPGGRLVETFADGSEYVIGQITDWDPPAGFAYDWRDPSWPGPISYSVQFRPATGGTTVQVTSAGFAALGLEEMIPYYAIGDRQVNRVYAAHGQAVYELQALQPAAGQTD